jgi:regulator of cell morphogenesis and NO signaling
MIEPDLDSSVVEWVIEFPLLVRLFEELGIDYHCAGKSLEYACRQQCLDPNETLTKLRHLVAASAKAAGDPEG